jgi:hypothetical protein
VCETNGRAGKRGFYSAEEKAYRRAWDLYTARRRRNSEACAGALTISDRRGGEGSEVKEARLRLLQMVDEVKRES